MPWYLQQINLGGGATVPGEYIAGARTNPEATARSAVGKGWLFVSAYNDQQHFSYVDSKANIQDVWWDGSNWHLQQINNANSGGVTVPGEYLVADHTQPNATAPAVLDDGLFVSPYGGQHHFAYYDGSYNIQDVWWDGNEWHLQQINNAFGNGGTVPGEWIAGDHTQPIDTARALPGAPPLPRRALFVSVFRDQQHFVYVDEVANLQDVWWDGNEWHLQQINNAYTTPTVANEYIASADAIAAAGDFFVSVYNNQQHFTYRDVNGNLQDVWYG
jgi:hypothetical protein